MTIWGCPALLGEWRCGGSEKEDGLSSNIVGGAVTLTTENLEKEAAFFADYSSKKQKTMPLVEGDREKFRLLEAARQRI